MLTFTLGVMTRHQYFTIDIVAQPLWYQHKPIPTLLLSADVVKYEQRGLVFTPPANKQELEQPELQQQQAKPQEQECNDWITQVIEDLKKVAKQLEERFLQRHTFLVHSCLYINGNETLIDQTGPSRTS